MSRNPVQFHKGVSLNEFLLLSSIEEQCFDALYQWRSANGFMYPQFDHDQCCQLTTRKLQQSSRQFHLPGLIPGMALGSASHLALTGEVA